MESTYTDPNNPDVVLGRSEIERRRQYINQMERNLLDGEGNPLAQMVKQCLHNVASRRPTAGELLACLQSVTADIEGAYGELEKLDAVRQVAMIKKLAGQEAERSSQMREKINEIRQLQHQLEHSQVILPFFYCYTLTLSTMKSVTRLASIISSKEVMHLCVHSCVRATEEIWDRYYLDK